MFGNRLRPQVRYDDSSRARFQMMISNEWPDGVSGHS